MTRKRWLILSVAAMWALLSVTAMAQCTPDSYEEDDACIPSKTVIYGGATQSHNFCEDAEDWLKFNACTGRSYTIETSNLGLNTDTVLELYDTDCAALASKIDGWVAPADGTYHVKVLQFDGTFGDDREYDITLTGDTSSCSPWARTYGGGFSEYGRSVYQTADGGFVVAGDAQSFGAGSDDDFWVLKLNTLGAIEWENTYGGASTDEAYSIQQTADGNFVVAGQTNSFGAGGYDSWVLKLDAFTGDVAWENTYGGTSNDGARSIRQTADGGFVVAGRTSSFGAGGDVWVLKLDANGDFLGPQETWQNTYGSASSETAYSIQQTSDGGFVVAGQTWFFSAGGDVWVLKLNPDGTIDWENTYEGISEDNAYSIQQTADGGYIVAGNTGTIGFFDIWILKLNPDGTIAWEKTYGGVSSDGAASIQQTSDGGFVVAGSTGAFGAGGSDLWFLKLNPDGTIAWEKTYGGASSDGAASIQQTSDGGFVVAGNTGSFGAGFSDFWVLKLRENGNIHFPACALTADTAAVVADTSAAMPDLTEAVFPTGVIPDPALVSATPSTAALDEQCATTCDFSISCSAGVDAAAVCIGTQQNFTGSISGSGEGALSYAWDFDYDGVTFDVMATGTTASYIYPAADGYTAAFRVTDSCADPSPQECLSTIPITIHSTINVIYDTTASLAQVCGDGDAIVEPGEEWQVTVQLLNDTPCAPATNVKADLTVNAGSAAAALVCGNPGIYGDMLPDATAQFTYSFFVDSAAACTGDITFDVTNIVSDEGTYPDRIPAFTVQVGARVTLLSEDFESCLVPPAGPPPWTEINNGFMSYGWVPRGLDCPPVCSMFSFGYPLPTNFAIVDSACDEVGALQDAELITPLIDAGAAINVTLEFAHDFATGLGGASGAVKVRSSITPGGDWVTKETYTGGDSAGTVVLDITPEAAGAADVEVNWHYQSMLDEYWAIDNVVVEASLPCDVSTGCACACVLPDVAYDAGFTPTEVCGDGDLVVEPGEEWQVTVQLVNNAAACTAANNVKADLAVNAGSAVAATVCNNPGLYGAIPGGATAQSTYSFVVDSLAVCVNDVTFDVTNVVSDEATYPDQIPAFNVTVGADATSELGTQATDPLNATGAPATSDFAPDFTLGVPAASASLDWASLTHAFVGTLNYTYLPVPAAVARKTTTTFTLAVAEVQTVSAVTTTINMTPPVRDSGGDTLDVILQSPALTPQVVYSGSRALWASGTFGPYAAFNGEGSGGDWQLIITHTAGGGAGSNGTLNQWDLAIDYSDPGDVTANTKVELVGPPPANNAVTLKDYTEAPNPPYTTEVLTHYNNEGLGTYRIRLSENAGATATLTGATLDVDVTAQCDASACACPAVPPSEPSPPGALDPLIIPTTAADQIIVENVADETGYVVYENVIGTWYGAPSQGCMSGGDVVDFGATVQLNYPMAVGDRWVVVSAANATGESSCGTDSDTTERNTAPGWPATGPCP